MYSILSDPTLEYFAWIFSQSSKLVITICNQKNSQVCLASTGSWWRTFLSLRIGDLQVAVSGLESFSAHNLLLKFAEGDIQPIKRNCVVVQFGIKFIVNTRHFHRSNHINQAQFLKKKHAWYDNKNKAVSTPTIKGYFDSPCNSVDKQRTNKIKKKGSARRRSPFKCHRKKLGG